MTTEKKLQNKYVENPELFWEEQIHLDKRIYKPVLFYLDVNKVKTGYNVDSVYPHRDGHAFKSDQEDIFDYYRDIPPIVIDDWDVEEGIYYFSDGHHRFNMLMRSGIRVLPVCILYLKRGDVHTHQYRRWGSERRTLLLDCECEKHLQENKKYQVKCRKEKQISLPVWEGELPIGE